ncbi:Putative oxysterol-binding protein [Septoria linicola]|uniref:Oxysterol-binding protein n=1 Tax=Septoria linicola TaxID=215465 RepID=A0A9Q9AP23_9PEZI|nr:putative oxysterol-binding protein [Septoria linicola]USW49618.1 Putative oxysterol-binding protein [Septoria linicola]
MPSPANDGASASSNAGGGQFLSPVRASMQSSHRPHLSTTMSNTQVSQSPSSPTKDTPITPSSATPGASIEQSVRLFKVFEALRSGDTAAIAKATRADGDAKLEGTTILHLAIQCAEMPVIEYVLSQHDADINATDREGNTPLHVAAMLGRIPVVKLLLEQKDVNDSSANYQGKTAIDVARNPEIFQMLQLSRSVYIDQRVRIIQQLVAKGDYDGLEELLGESRVRSTLDINGPELATEPATTADGGSLLHEAARKKDLKLAQLLLLNGADPFRRDRRGKLPQDVTKDDKTRAILKRSPAAAAAQRQIQEQTILGGGSQASGIPTGESGPGSKESREMKGYLKKWTNYTSGYKLRWFVLEDGVLSYYKHQDDAGSACRGAINMRIAALQMDPKDKDKLHFEIHGKSSVKYDLKANHQVEAKRWFWALNNAIQWAKDEAKEEQKRERQEASAKHEQLERIRTREMEVAHSGGGLIPATAVSGGSTPMAGSTLGDGNLSAYDPSEADGASVIIRNLSRTGTATIERDLDDDEEYGDDASSHEIKPANKDAFSITAQSAKLQLDLLEQVSAALRSEKDKSPETSLGHPTVVQALSSYEHAVGNLKGLLMDLLRISRDHEAYWQYRLEREQNIRSLWEDSMAKVAREQEELENRIGESEDKRKRTKKALKDALDGTNPASRVGSPLVEGGDTSRPLLEVPAGPSVKRRQTIAELTNNEISDDESEEEDEFFDAVDAGEVEIVTALPEPPRSPEAIPHDKAGAQDDSSVENDRRQKEQQISKSYRGYEDGLRKRLKIDADNRPKVSLWAVLKSMIGKDMTKMTLPVTFNEPTSLHYAVVADMEYTTLLNTAADRTDSSERMVYVAAFAASEYAGTIGRVAKPFNPLLGETFEYVRPDEGYRFFIEQVTHHPPVGAAYAESAKWTYYGESNVKSKFYGKSFEFNPTGTWYLHIRPIDGGPEEVYTWKKVTSSVVGILTGNPVVDNYGLMEIKNWTTGETALVDFKPRGWKASSAYQVSGKVLDRDGKTRWSLGGRWNDKIYARLTPGYEGSVDPSEGSAEKGDKAFLVWEAHYRPPPGEIPFNLTPFVVTLNDLPEKLKPLVAPTDSRLRPDQRAMEDAEYDFAATEKTRVEEGQRARRRVREAKGEEFVPRWFVRAKHPVTGEEFWKFNHEYWQVRDEVAEGKRNWGSERLEEIF